MTYLINNNNKIINLSLLNIGLYLSLFIILLIYIYI